MRLRRIVGVVAPEVSGQLLVFLTCVQIVLHDKAPYWLVTYVGLDLGVVIQEEQIKVESYSQTICLRTHRSVIPAR